MKARKDDDYELFSEKECIEMMRDAAQKAWDLAILCACIERVGIGRVPVTPLIRHNVARFLRDKRRCMQTLGLACVPCVRLRRVRATSKG